MSKRKLLLADDSVTIQKVVDLTFADEGFEVITVGDGNSAMDKLREENPDLIMADVNMPGLNGYEICEKIKHGDSYQDIPVILLVGSFEPFDEDEANRVGANLHLTKPFQSINQLVDSVMALLPDSRDGEADSSKESDLVDENTDEFSIIGNSEVDNAEIHHEQVESFSGEENSEYEAVSDVGMDDEAHDFHVVEDEAIDVEVVEDESIDDNEAETRQESEEVYALNGDLDTEVVSGDESERVKKVEGDPLFDLDDSSLLELSFLEKDVESEVEVSDEISDSDEDAFSGDLEEASNDEEDSTETYFAENNSFESNEEVDDVDETSSELINEIVRRVVASMSDDVIREVASKVVPERADSIIREIAEEKMNT